MLLRDLDLNWFLAGTGFLILIAGMLVLNGSDDLLNLSLVTPTEVSSSDGDKIVSAELTELYCEPIPDSDDSNPFPVYEKNEPEITASFSRYPYCGMTQTNTKVCAGTKQEAGVPGTSTVTSCQTLNCGDDVHEEVSVVEAYERNLYTSKNCPCKQRDGKVINMCKYAKTGFEKDIQYFSYWQLHPSKEEEQVFLKCPVIPKEIPVDILNKSCLQGGNAGESVGVVALKDTKKPTTAACIWIETKTPPGFCSTTGKMDCKNPKDAPNCDPAYTEPPRLSEECLETIKKYLLRLCA